MAPHPPPSTNHLYHQRHGSLTAHLSGADLLGNQRQRNCQRHCHQCSVACTIGVRQKLMRHSNVATTMSVYGNTSLRAKQRSNSKVVQMVIPQELSPAVRQSAAV